MSDTLMTDFSSYCRVCLQLPEVDQILDLTTIYDEDEQLSYYDCFRICTAIDLQANNKMDPHNICISCGLELQMVYDFFKKIDESKKFLEQLRHQQQQQLQQNEHEESLNNIEASKVELQPEQHIVELEVESLSETPLSASTEDVEVIDCHIEVEEEHLDMDDYQEVEEIEDDNDDDFVTANVDGMNNSETDEYLIETVVMSDDDDIIEIETKEKTNALKWQQAVVAVANESHLPLTSDNMKQTATLPPVRVSLLKSKKRQRHMGQHNCDVCNKQFPNYSRMLTHSRIHSDDRPKFNCDNCGRIYATKQALEVHIRSVHMKTGYVCSICDKVYAIKKGLEVHMRYHTGIFPYECDLCDKKFAQASHLTTHKSVKHNSARFCCEFPNCGRYFTSSASLRNHEFKHGDMPFECSFCQQGYPAKAKLKVHIRRRHGEEMTLDQIENMRKFHVARSKLNLVQIPQIIDAPNSLI